MFLLRTEDDEEYTYEDYRLCGDVHVVKLVEDQDTIAEETRVQISPSTA